MKMEIACVENAGTKLTRLNDSFRILSGTTILNNEVITKSNNKLREIKKNNCIRISHWDFHDYVSKIIYLRLICPFEVSLILFSHGQSY